MKCSFDGHRVPSSAVTSSPQTLQVAGLAAARASLQAAFMRATAAWSASCSRCRLRALAWLHTRGEHHLNNLSLWFVTVLMEQQRLKFCDAGARQCLWNSGTSTILNSLKAWNMAHAICHASAETHLLSRASAAWIRFWFRLACAQCSHAGLSSWHLRSTTCFVTPPLPSGMPSH